MRAAKLEQAYRELQEMDKLKDELVQNVSHELRTPLTFIKGYVEPAAGRGHGAAERNAARESDDRRRQDQCADAPGQRHHLSCSRSNGNRCSFPLQDMREMARLALQSCEVAAVTAGISLRLQAESDLPPIPVDRDRINQVFDNLLGNAIKFSPRGGTITIEVQDAGDRIQIERARHGRGHSRRQVGQRCFDRFYQVDGSATRRFGGAGSGSGHCAPDC